MNKIITLIANPLGYAMWLCYVIIKNYGLAIIIFTLLTKIVLFPISLKVQKNSIKMVKLKPRLDEIAVRYAGDKDKIAEEQIKLYDEEHYSPAAGCLPMLLQIPLILGIINVIYNPLQHLLHLDKQVISAFIDKTIELLKIEKVNNSMHMKVIETVNNGQYLEEFQSLKDILPNYNINEIISSIQNFNTKFLGINLLEVPSISNFNAVCLVPILATLSMFLLSIIQNKENVLQKEQGFWGKWGVSIFLIAFTLNFTFTVPAGVGVYWIFTNLFAILQIYLLNAIHDPKKYIDYDAKSKSEYRLQEQKKIEQEKKKEYKENTEREKIDYKRFFNTDNKQLVFYSQKNGFYKYFENVIGYILKNSDIVIHYVTSDPNDNIFNKKNTQIVPYYISEKKLITFMMKMDADMVVMTMPDLETYHIKRSYVRKDVEYVYMHHYPLSTHMIFRKGAFDHFDTIFCVGKIQELEIRKTEKAYNLPQKNLILAGYGLIENMVEDYNGIEDDLEDKDYKNIIIAPSWHDGNILDSCIHDILKQLLSKGYNITVRPHPEYIKRYMARMNEIVDEYKDYTGNDLNFELDFSSSKSVFTSDVLISDWSGVAYEYAFVTKKPVLFIDTKMKVNNEEYLKIEIEPLEISLRDKIGIRLGLDEMQDVEKNIRSLLNNQKNYEDTINKIFNDVISNLGHSGEIGGRYIIERLGEKAGNI